MVLTPSDVRGSTQLVVLRLWLHKVTSLHTGAADKLDEEHEPLLSD